MTQRKTYTTEADTARAQVEELALGVQHLKAKRTRAATAQIVRSPLAGEVVEVRTKDATAAGLALEIMIVSEVNTCKN